MEGGCEAEGYSKAVDIEKMTKNHNPGFFNIIFWGEGGIEGEGGRTMGWGVGAICLICDILYQLNIHVHCYKVSSRYSIWLPSYGLHKISQRVIITPYTSKGKQLFSYLTCLNLIYIAIIFYHHIPNGYRCTKIVLKSSKGHNSTTY